ncbi:MAG: hypothetical protein ACHQHO_03795 [Solirubrobacterales bacterium]
MSPRRRPLLAVPALVLLACAAPARADVFGASSLVSASAVTGDPHNQQADRADDAAISGDGRYVAFDGSFGGRTGVFRRDLLSGVVATVAEGEAVQPSISEDGRYVSFTTTVALDQQNDTNVAPDVYVRDMSRAQSTPCPIGWEESEEARQACAFTLVSAVSGESRGLSYAYGPNASFEETHNGSVASGRSAISSDGRTVAFVTTAVSNLANPSRPAPPLPPEAAETPAMQVAVRHLDSLQTELVSVQREPSTGGAQENGSGQPLPVPVASEGSSTYGAVYPGSTPGLSFPSPWAGASISADGSTVAWLGQQIGRQAAVLPGDEANVASYTEPLWRRIGEGQGAPTRRVTGGSDPLNPACSASGEARLFSPATLSDPCQGPFDTSASPGSSVPGIWTFGTGADFIPRLSADGMTVAFLASAREVASGEELKSGESSNDLYVVDMRDGFTRVAATRRLTELAGGSTSEQARSAPIVDLGVSPDGSQVAFTSRRTIFPLGSPSYVSAPAAAAGMDELYDVDLTNDTLTRVTAGFDGRPSETFAEDAGLTDSPSFSGDGNLLAFSSDAFNLVYGDGNKARDAFVVPRIRFVATPPLQAFSSMSPNPAVARAWNLDVTALARRDGTVLLEVRVPGAGTLRAGARSAVRVRASRAAVRSRGHRRSRMTVATRTVAARAAQPKAEGLVLLTLKLARAYSALASARGGLSATVGLTFSARGKKTLRAGVPVTFVRAVHRKAQSASSKSRHASRGRRRR